MSHVPTKQTCSLRFMQGKTFRKHRSLLLHKTPPHSKMDRRLRLLHVLTMRYNSRRFLRYFTSINECSYAPIRSSTAEDHLTRHAPRSPAGCPLKFVRFSRAVRGTRVSFSFLTQTCNSCTRNIRYNSLSNVIAWFAVLLNYFSLYTARRCRLLVLNRCLAVRCRDGRR